MTENQEIDKMIVDAKEGRGCSIAAALEADLSLGDARDILQRISQAAPELSSYEVWNQDKQATTDMYLASKKEISNRGSTDVEQALRESSMLGINFDGPYYRSKATVKVCKDRTP